MKKYCLVAGALASALALSACSSEPSVNSQEETVEAIASSLDGSYRWAFQYNFQLTDEDIDILAEDEPFLDNDELRDEINALNSYVFSGAIADDESVQWAMSEDGENFLDVRSSASLDGTVMSVTMLVQADTRKLVVDIGDENPEWYEEDIEELRQDAEFFGDFGEALLAVVDGEWGGVEGDFDLEELGLTEGEIEEFTAEFEDGQVELTYEEILELVDAGMTFHTFELQEDGTTTVLFDLHAERGAEALEEILGDAADAAELDDVGDLPETLSEFGTFTFDEDGLLVGMSIDFLSIFQGESGDLLVRDGDLTEDELEQARSLEGPIEMTVSFSDHGAVETTLDVEGGTVVDVEEALTSLFFGIGPDDWDAEWDSGWDEDWTDEWTDEDQAEWESTMSVDEMVAQDLEIAAMNLDFHYDMFGEYSDEALTADFGFFPWDGVVVTLETFDDMSYCLHGTHEGDPSVQYTYDGFMFEEGLNC